MDTETTTAWIARGFSGTVKRYHTDANCPSKKKAQNLQETTVTKAKLRGLQHCGNCGRDYNRGNYDQSFQEALKEASQ